MIEDTSAAIYAILGIGGGLGGGYWIKTILNNRVKTAILEEKIERVEKDVCLIKNDIRSLYKDINEIKICLGKLSK